MSGWISVKVNPRETYDNVVYESIEYLVTDGVVVSVSSFITSNGHGNPWLEWDRYGSISPHRITHWMPLPEPPSC